MSSVQRTEAKGLLHPAPGISREAEYLCHLRSVLTKLRFPGYTFRNLYHAANRKYSITYPVLQERPDMRHQNNVLCLLVSAPQGLLVEPQLEENIFGGAYLAVLVLRKILDMHQSQEKFSARQHTRSPSRATRTAKIFFVVGACPECFAIMRS